MLFADILNIVTVFLPIGPIFTVPIFTVIFLESTFQGFAHITNPLCKQHSFTDLRAYPIFRHSQIIMRLLIYHIILIPNKYIS